MAPVAAIAMPAIPKVLEALLGGVFSVEEAEESLVAVDETGAPSEPASGASASSSVAESTGASPSNSPSGLSATGVVMDDPVSSADTAAIATSARRARRRTMNGRGPAIVLYENNIIFCVEKEMLR
jgi:hypothetical protein